MSGVKVINLNTKLKFVDVKNFNGKSSYHNLHLYEAYCQVQFQININVLESLPIDVLNAISHQSPVVTIKSNGEWKILGGLFSVFLANEGLITQVAIYEVDNPSEDYINSIIAGELWRPLCMSIDRKKGLASLLSSAKKLFQDVPNASGLKMLSQKKTLARLAGGTREVIRNQQGKLNANE